MAFTSLKVRDTDKKEFDRLRHEVALRGGEDLSQHELFHRILELALASKTSWIGPSSGKRRSWSAFQFDLPQETDAASELDDVVYGDP